MSWLRVEILEPLVGVVHVPGARRPWAFCRARIVGYPRSGFTVATLPVWLVGFLSMGRHPSRSAGRAWHRHYRAGLAAGWIVEHEKQTAADHLSAALRSHPGAVVRAGRPEVGGP